MPVLHVRSILRHRVARVATFAATVAASIAALAGLPIVLALATLVAGGSRPNLLAQTPTITVTPQHVDGNRSTWVTMPFTLTNNTATTQWGAVSATCSDLIWDQWNPQDDPSDYGECVPTGNTWISLAPHEARAISVSVWTGNMTGVASVVLAADFNAFRYVGWDSLFVPGRPKLTQTTTTPKDTAITVPANSYQTVTFTQVNHGTYKTPLMQEAFDCGPFVVDVGTQCGWWHVNEPGKWYDYYLNPLDPVPVSIGYKSGAAGTRGYIRLFRRMADPTTGVMAYDTSSILVMSGAQLMPSVSPKSAAKTILPARARTDTFTVVNTGTVSADYNFLPRCGTFAAGGCSVSPSGATIAAGASVSVLVSYLPPATIGSTNTIRLVASGSVPNADAQVDSGSVVVTTFDADPAVTITPTAGTVVTSQVVSATVAVCDDGTVNNPVVAFNDSTLPDMFVARTQSGCGSAGLSTFTLSAAPGLNRIRVIVSDGYHVDTVSRVFTYDDAAQVAPQVQPMFPASAYPSARIPAGVAWADSFTVRNPGPVDAVYTISASCGAFVGCSPSPSTVTIRAGATVTVAATYTSPSVAGQSATVQVTATHTSATGHVVSGSASVTSVVANGLPPRVTVTPDDGATYDAPAATVTIAWCDPDDAIASRQVWLGGSSLPNTFVAATVAGCASAGTSTWTNLALLPWDQLLIAQATDAAGHITRVGHTIRYASSLLSYAPQVTPKGTTRAVTRGVSSTQTFFIRNTGAYSATYQLTPSCGSYTVCTTDKSSLTLVPGAQDSAHVSFLTPSTISVYSPVRLRARYSSPVGPSIADSGEVMMHTPTAAELYQPRVFGTYDLGIVSSPAIYGLTFLVQNTGTEDANYYVTGATSGGATYTTGPPMRLFVAAGATVGVGTGVSMPTSPGAAGSASLIVFYTASDNTVVQSTGAFAFRTATTAAAMVVSPIDSSIVVPRDFRPDTVRVIVRNPGAAALTVTLSSPQCTAPLVCTLWGASQTVPPYNGSVSVPVVFTLGDMESARIVVRVQGQGGGSAIFTDSAVFRVSHGALAGHALAISPDSQSVSAAIGALETRPFLITNRGAVTSVFRYSVTCDNTGGAFASCLPVTNAYTEPVLSGQSVNVPVQYTTVSVSGKKGLIRISAVDTAVHGGTPTNGVFALTTRSAVSVDVQTVGASTTIARDECLTIAVGDDAAYECGDLRLVHALPSTTTMNRTRTPTLIYDSRHRSGVVLFPADVRITAPNVTSIVARVTIAGSVPVAHTFTWRSEWSTGAPHRIVVPVNVDSLGIKTGAYTYHLFVDAQSGTTVFSNQDSSIAAVVNRSSSQFLPGWWLDGLEQVFPVANGTDTASKLWVGGDGSTRYYTKCTTVACGDTVWTVLPTVDRPDTLTATPSHNGFVRHLRNGARVEFDNAGRHMATVNGQGHRTTFYYNAVNRSSLDSLTVPTRAGSARRSYVFLHDPSTQNVIQVSAPHGNVARVTSLTYLRATDGSPLSYVFTDPDARSVGFRLDSKGRVVSRMNRRGDSTAFRYDAGQALALATVFTSPSNIVRSFCAAETSSVSDCAAGPADVASVATVYDGPRTDIDDRSRFYVTRYGAPATIIDALSDTTTLERSDPAWPLLVTKTTDPRGHVVMANYLPGRGLLASTTDVDPNSATASVHTASATTTYLWHTKWDRAVQVASPLGITSYFEYNTSGDRTSERVGPSDARKIRFGYDADTRLLDSITTPQSTRPMRFDYDAVGNLWRTTTPMGFVTTQTRDYLGRDSLVAEPTDGISAPWRYHKVTYDVMDRVLVSTDSAATRVTDDSPMVLAVRNYYDNEGNDTLVVRTQSPDPLGLSDIAIASQFDAAGRKTREYDPNRLTGDPTTHSWTYDAAGNALTTHRGDGVVSAEFDALNRVTHRLVDGAANPYTPQAASDDQRFVYDRAGNLTAATNRYAQVMRGYSIGGRLLGDTLRIANADLSGGSVFGHEYVSRYEYDLEGRRATFSPPTNLGVLSPLSYGYDVITGDLQIVTVQNGGVYKYGYSAAGLLDSLVEADRTVERHLYDDDGRETERREYSPALLRMLHDDVVGLDARGKRTNVNATNVAGGTGGTYTYDGLGGAASADGRIFESTPRDPLGNAVLRSRSNSPWPETYKYFSHSTRMLFLSQQLTDAGRFDSTEYKYDGSTGDLTLVQDIVSGPVLCVNPGQTTLAECLTPGVGRRIVATSTTHNDYDADGHLLSSTVATTNDGSAFWPRDGRDPQDVEVYAPFGRGVMEEYRYDALGRRVWVRAHREPYCPGPRDRDSTTTCISTIERTIYDGDQVIAEVRQPGDADVGAAVLERDDPGAGLPIRHFGQVGYVHGLGIDHPLELWRNYSGAAVPTKLVLHYAWEGGLDVGSTMDGSLVQCTLAVANTGCEDIDWPGAKLTFGMVIPSTSVGPQSWWGTLAGMKQNATGVLDMRNRQYDPKSGRFTQEDPIGLAGGMNLYGFGGGDPVNYRDPFGLWPWPELASSAGLIMSGGGALLGGLSLGGPAGWIAIGGLALAGTLDHLAGATGGPQLSMRAEADATSVVLERRSGRSLKGEWEGLHGKPWPEGCVAHHICPLADGGEDNATNIEPKTPGDHVQGHKDNGDFKRWGARSKKDPPKKEPEQQQP